MRNRQTMRNRQAMLMTVILLAICGVCMNTSAVAQSNLTDVDQQQAAQISALRSELEDLKSQSMGYDDDSDSGFGTIDIHGFVSQGFMQSDRNNYLTLNTEKGSFQYNDLGLNFSTALSDKLRLGTQFYSRDLGTLGNNQIEVDWAFADYRWKDSLGLRFGKIKSSQGLYNETRDYDMLRTFALLPQAIYNEINRGTEIAIHGLGLYGDTALGRAGGLSYQAQFGQRSIPNDGGYALFLENALGNLDDIQFDEDYAYASSLIWDTPLDGLRLGISRGSQSFDVNYSNRNAMFGGFIPAGTAMLSTIDDMVVHVLSAEYTHNNLILAAEYITSRGDVTTGTTTTTLSQTMLDSDGAYLSASYRLNDRCEVGTYFSSAHSDPSDRDGSDYEAAGTGPSWTRYQRDLAVCTRVDLTENWILKIEGHKMRGTRDLMAMHNPSGANPDWLLFIVKTSLSF